MKVAGALLTGAVLTLAMEQQAFSQAAPAVPAGPAPAATAESEDDVVELSPFEVTSDSNQGYTATATLAGTRVRTELRDIASSLSVVTSQFLRDTGATDNQTLLPYQTNTEVGGLVGNYAGVGNIQGASEGGRLSRPNTNTRVRGLDEADNTRDYFLSDISWDSYNVDRVELQRGPNSILFGVGSPAGIINTSTITANLTKNGGKVEGSFGSYGGWRMNGDYNQVILKNKFAVRVAAVNELQKFRQDPSFSRNRRVFVTGRGNIQVLPKDLASELGVRVSVEKGDIKSNNPRSLAPIDKVSAFYDPYKFVRENGKVKLYDAPYSWSFAQQMDRGTKVLPNNYPDFQGLRIPALGNEMGIPDGPLGIYENGSDVGTGWQTVSPSAMFGRKSDGTIDRGIDAFPFGRLQEVAGLFEYSQNANVLDPNMYPAASKGFYKDLSMRDSSIFDFYNNLIDGPNKREWNRWDSLNLALSQQFFSNRLGFEFVYDRQDLEFGNSGLLGGGNPSIGIDINSTTLERIGTYTKNIGDWGDDVPEVAGSPNPNAGRAYIAGTGGNGYKEQRVRENWRYTGFGEFRGSDVFEKDSFFAKLFNRSTLTGLYSRDNRNYTVHQWNRFATDVEWARMQDRPTGVNESGRRVPWVVYLSGDLTSRTTASGLGLDRLRSYIDPHGTVTARYFDSHWAKSENPASPNYVDPAAPYTLPMGGGASTQSENPANYVGWTTGTMQILNADHGDYEQLITSANERREELRSRGLTLQSYLWGDTIIPTYGWRDDRIRTYGTEGALDPLTQTRSIHIDNVSRTGADAPIASGSLQTRTWGVVAKLPPELRGKAPFGLDISGFYNRSNNLRADNRVGFDGKPVAYPSGTSKDYGVVISALDDRVSLKLTWYDTAVKGANIPGGNPLGQNSWFLGNIQAWGAAASQIIRMGRAGEAPGLEWFWNYALVDENKWGDAVWSDPNSPEVKNHPAMIKQLAAVEDFVKTSPGQDYMDAFGYPINVAKLQSSSYADQKSAVTSSAWNIYAGIGALQPAGGGKVNGLSPVGTIDQQSKGVEIELYAQPLKNWDLTFNASKTTASRTNIGAEFASWIEGQKTRFDGPAGDLRMWWGGDKTYRFYYDQFIYQAYLFQKEANGQSAPEIRPWRFNLITNYRFDDGILKGVNLGGGYRWQDEVILGYRLDSTKTKLDVHNPIKGASEDAFDMWVGYGRKLTNKIDWQIQLNLRNVGEKAHLVPYSANPDGTFAGLRIVDGMTWTIRNTFSF
ncbi:MAG: TonB-dependent receptor plug domain-containing protein [Opitutaceae bacterium]|nr:TonB-dependent receptor plug domain-containing protein [Opitutaceae bacterium]